MEGLSSEYLAAQTEVVGLRHWLNENRQIVCDQLFEVINQVDSMDDKHQLIQLKRDIYNQRPLTKLERFTYINRPLIMEWLDKYGTYKRKYDYLKENYPTEIYRIRKELQKYINDHGHFSNSIPFSSTSLSKSVQKYVQTHPGNFSKKLKKMETSLIQYVGRASTKTSPYSQYTTVTWGEWDNATEYDFDNREFQSRVQINNVAVLRLLDALQKHPDVKRHLPYSLNKEVTFDNTHLSFFVHEDNPIRQRRVFKSKGKKVQMGWTKPLQVIFGLYKEEKRIHYQHIESKLLGYGLPKDKVQAFLYKLMDIGLLESSFHFDHQTPHLLDDVIFYLSEFDHPMVEEVNDLFRHIRQLMDELMNSSFDSTTRTQIIIRIEKDLEKAYEIVERSDLMMKKGTVLYEDSAFVGDPLKLEEQLWRRPLEDVKNFLGIAPVFDPFSLMQNKLIHTFLKEFPEGECEDVDDFVEKMHPHFEKFLSQMPPNDLTIEDEPATMEEKLSNIRTRLVLHILDNLPKGNEDDLYISRDFFNELINEVPDYLRKQWASYGVFGQLHEEESGKKVCINHIYNGLSQFKSRFLPMFEEDKSELVKKNVENFFNSNQLNVEIRGTFGFNANIHPPYSNLELEIPDYHTERNASEKLNYKAVKIAYDDQLKQLIALDKESGKRMNFIYSGFLIPFLMPPRITLLTSLNGNSQIPFYFHLFAENQLSDLEKRQIRVYPRIRLGDAVLFRKRWFIPKDKIPQRKHLTEQEYFLSIQEWLADHDLPVKTFIRFSPGSFDDLNEGTELNAVQAEEFFNSFKPMYMNFQHPLFVKLFQKLHESNEYDLVLEEMLPSPEGQVIKEKNKAFVSEFLFEFNKREDRLS